jgi:[NiFe] hydrogenase diaphorase moiety small subunit
MSESKTFRLNGKEIPFVSGQTIMDAAMAAGVYIPHLCHDPDLPPHGSCRVCVVDKSGRQVSACTELAEEKTAVESDSTQIRDTRRAILQMLFVEGNHVCPGCEKSGACQLQAIAYYTGMLEPHFTHFFPRREVDASHPDFIIDFNRCILCELCVRASRDHDGKGVFAISGRGIDSHLVIESPTGRLGESSFEATDSAALICPVGAILPKHRGYDVPMGERLYDREPISRVGDVAANEGES